ncbi:MAG TPA: VOC family protein [Jatrophihabitans sp.]|nr:VOC family protein [Jatrophihabitans sp.]
MDDDQLSDEAPVGALHHLEIWVPDLERAIAKWGWLLTELGYRLFQEWPSGRSWRLGATYLVFEQSPALTATEHDRCSPGLNHIAFHAGRPDQVDALTGAAQLHGWSLMFPAEHPHAGGRNHYAAYLVNTDGYEIELVAQLPAARSGATAWS